MNWKVSKERVEVLPHDNAENLVVVKLGSYQVVAQKDLYQNNDVVVFSQKNQSCQIISLTKKLDDT